MNKKLFAGTAVAAAVVAALVYYRDQVRDYLTDKYESLTFPPPTEDVEVVVTSQDQEESSG